MISPKYNLNYSNQKVLPVRTSTKPQQMQNNEKVQTRLAHTLQEPSYENLDSYNNL